MRSSFDAPPENVVRAFASLKNDANMQVIVDWLSDCVVSMALASCTMEDDKARNWQDGKVQALVRILTLHKESNEMMRKFNDSFRNMEQMKVGAF